MTYLLFPPDGSVVPWSPLAIQPQQPAGTYAYVLENQKWALWDGGQWNHRYTEDVPKTIRTLALLHI